MPEPRPTLKRGRCPRCGAEVELALDSNAVESVALELPAPRAFRVLTARECQAYAVPEVPGSVRVEHVCHSKRAGELADAIRCFLAGAPRSILEDALTDPL